MTDEIKPEKISPEDIRVEKLSSAHTDILPSLQSYEPELVKYLLEDALKQQDGKICVTYLWFHRKTNELLGYITMSNDSVKLKKISKELQEELNLKGINYKSLPAIKIGRLCVADNFLRRGIGTLMIQFTINMIHDLNKKTGCRFIVLDAKRNKDKSKDTIHFYTKLGFKILKEKDRRETPMYLDTFPYLKQLSK